VTSTTEPKFDQTSNKKNHDAIEARWKTSQSILVYDAKLKKALRLLDEALGPDARDERKLLDHGGITKQ